MRSITSLLLASTAVVFAIAPAQASTFVFDRDDVGGKLDVGDHANITTTYNTDTELLTWSSTFRRNSAGSNRLAEGGWLVISEGGMPSMEENEYAIFYLDGNTEQVLAYNYDGKVNERSYQNETLLDTTALEVINNGPDERTFKFAFDATDINSRTDLGPSWKGVGFAEEVGIWFHGVDGLSTSYKADNTLESFTFTKQGWYDIENEDTVLQSTSVPEPGSIAALSAFAITAAASTKLRKRTA